MKTAAKKNIYIGDLHFEHEMWNRELRFCKDELVFLQNRLEEVTAKNTDHDFLREVEHFQNQIIVQNQNVDEFLHAIKMKEHELAEFAKEHPVAVDHVHFEDHGAMRANMEGFHKVYNELKHDFRKFLAKWM